MDPAAPWSSRVRIFRNQTGGLDVGRVGVGLQAGCWRGWFVGGHVLLGCTWWDWKYVVHILIFSGICFLNVSLAVGREGQ